MADRTNGSVRPAGSVAQDPAAAHERLRLYIDNLTDRLRLQAEWHARHPEHPDPYRRDIPDAVFAADPYPWTNDTLTAQRFADLVLLVVTLFEEARHG
jgi:hypothetical protein